MRGFSRVRYKINSLLRTVAHRTRWIASFDNVPLSAGHAVLNRLGTDESSTTYDHYAELTPYEQMEYADYLSQRACLVHGLSLFSSHRLSRRRLWKRWSPIVDAHPKIRHARNADVDVG